MLVVLRTLKVIPRFNREILALAVVYEVPIVLQLALQELYFSIFLQTIAFCLKLPQLFLRHGRKLSV